MHRGLAAGVLHRERDTQRDLTGSESTSESYKMSEQVSNLESVFY